MLFQAGKIGSKKSVLGHAFSNTGLRALVVKQLSLWLNNNLLKLKRKAG